MSFRKKTNDGGTKWIVQRNKKILGLKKKNRVFPNKRFRKQNKRFLLNKRFF